MREKKESLDLELKKTCNPSRIMLAGVSSGSGKTLITCGLLQAMLNRKLNIVSFKCGPDYIDPMFHTEVIGAKSRNLDSFFSDSDTLRYLLHKNSLNSDLAIIEGVMGYYDGIGGISTDASSYHVASVTKTPVILVVNCKGMSLSILSLIKGFLTYKEDSGIKGVILNQISPMIYKELKQLIEEQLSVKVLGYLPNVKEFTIESRHLGLVTPAEIDGFIDKLNQLSKVMEETLDLDGIIEIARGCEEISYKEPSIPKLNQGKKPVKIAVAKDAAFCFYYQDNLELLEQMGAELIYFSPISDNTIPEGTQGILLGGGYPELHIKELSENMSMRNSIHSALKSGVPCIAECGGYLYLNETLEDQEGDPYPMVGFLKGAGYKTGKLGRFGYITLTANKNNMLCKKGEEIRGHEFHYWDCTENGSDFIAEKPLRKRNWNCVHTGEHYYAGFPHLYYYSNLELVQNFLMCCNKKCNRT